MPPVSDELFILAYSKYPVLFNCREKNYKDVNVRENALKGVSKELGLKLGNLKDLDKKYAAMKKTFRVLRSKARPCPSGSEANDFDPNHSWPLYTLFASYFGDYIQTRRRSSRRNVSVQLSSEDENSAFEVNQSSEEFFVQTQEDFNHSAQLCETLLTDSDKENESEELFSSNTSLTYSNEASTSKLLLPTEKKNKPAPGKTKKPVPEIENLLSGALKAVRTRMEHKDLKEDELDHFMKRYARRLKALTPSQSDDICWHMEKMMLDAEAKNRTIVPVVFLEDS